MALSLESIKQLAALDGKGSRENMIRAGQALLMQLLAAGMFRSLRMNGEEALLAAQNGKNLMLIEIEGQLCIAPANEALQKLLANTVNAGQLSARAMNVLLKMSAPELAALEGKTIVEIEIITDNISVAQRNVIGQVESQVIVLSDNAGKGNYGEMKMDQYFEHWTARYILREMV